MIRGTTAQFRFQIPYQKSDLLWATMTFWQPGNIDEFGSTLSIQKRLDDCVDSNNPAELCVSLNASDTMKFSDKIKARAQLRAETKDGNIFASHQQLITVYPINDEMLEADSELPAEKDGWIILDGEPII